MALVPDIVESWRHPRLVVRRHLARPRSEAFAFTFLFVFLLVAFVAQWPQAARASYLHPEVPLTQRLLAAGLGLMATIPAWYGLAALSRLIARALGGQGNWYGTRVALFWALAAVSPAMLLQGLTSGLLGPGAQAELVGALVAVAFLVLWLAMLREEEGAT
ncbi:Yip1 family protein [Fuscibacter oryzae]|uniref:YIP1 family protein n=1 Tax=Fuscibacter oryzae TaxID=2803939 RepID=A0A8J7STH6_9RHOB|nr:Yip1 family protein [Fuscibacter oryzae]MBL4927512.1 YIP1 family protein [Fuscibacter oryzae]